MRKLSVRDLVEDVRKSLAAKTYLSALSLALTLPDIMAQIEYPELKGQGNVGNRYKRWINEYYVFENPNKRKHPESETTVALEGLMDKFDGKFFYDLRCSFLHDGSNDVSKRISDLNFELSFDEGNSTTVWGYPGHQPYQKNHVLSVPTFCNRVCDITERLLDKWKDDPEKQECLEKYEIKLSCIDNPHQ
jgi:hypothetical protein